jgi:N-acetylglutamate synthase-like GNAT family acetyltransferase
MNKQAGFELIESAPSPENYIRVRVAAGLSGRSLDAARVGLAHSLHAVHVRHRSEVIGVGRVIGDGGCFFEIVDVAVVPQHQGKGVGKMIMLSIMKFLKARAPKTAYVSLIADQPSFYLQFGFKPCAPDEGMCLFIE